MKVLNKSVERVNTGKVELQDLTLLKPALIPNKRVVMAAVHLKFINLSRRTVQLLTALYERLTPDPRLILGQVESR